MKVLLLSDSHGLTEELHTIKSRHQVDHMIHCGDSELDFDSDELQGMYRVGGNCDFDARFPNDEVITLGDLTFYVTHGHLYQVKSNVTTLSYRGEEVGANVICFGHTHIAGSKQISNQLFINPGSIRLPRNRTEKTYAIVEWETLENIDVHFYNAEDGTEVEELSYQASF